MSKVTVDYTDYFAGMIKRMREDGLLSAASIHTQKKIHYGTFFPLTIVPSTAQISYVAEG